MATLLKKAVRGLYYADIPFESSALTRAPIPEIHVCQGAPLFLVFLIVGH